MEAIELSTITDQKSKMENPIDSPFSMIPSFSYLLTKGNTCSLVHFLLV